MIKKNIVVAIDYTLTVDGEVIDSTKDREPLEFLQGHGNIIAGLEENMLGMEIGESKDLTVSPEDGYGKTDEEAFLEIPTNEFPENIPVEIGTELEVQDDEGKPAYARIEKIENNVALLNFNHPLAGKKLHFAVTVISLREPSEEELAHGHVHHAEHEH